MRPEQCRQSQVEYHHLTRPQLAHTTRRLRLVSQAAQSACRQLGQSLVVIKHQHSHDLECGRFDATKEVERLPQISQQLVDGRRIPIRLRQLQLCPRPSQ